jgi:hypothetical protein
MINSQERIQRAVGYLAIQNDIDAVRCGANRLDISQFVFNLRVWIREMIYITRRFWYL